MPTRKACKDCGSNTRVLSHPGPRCATCWRKVQKERKQQAYDRHIADTYGLAADEYAALLAYQGGRCAICQKSNGTVRRLAVDHDHETGEVRGLLCKLCNRYLLGYAGVETLQRALIYLRYPPARELRSAK